VVTVPVYLTSQPQSLTNLQGTTANFSVTAAGTTPIAYQWRFGGVNLTGQTNSALAVANVQATNAGNYDVVVTNGFGAVTSSIASLAVNVPVFVATPPQNQTNLLGT